MMVGDFNSVLSPLDCEERFVEKKCPALQDLVTGFNYVDAFRHLHPGAREYTFLRPSCTSSRLDRLYVHRGCSQDILSISHGPSLADHRYVVSVLHLEQSGQGVAVGAGANGDEGVARRKSPYWKLNNSILKSEDFLQNFRELYENLRDKMSEYQNVSVWWDILVKPEIKIFCINFSKMLAQGKRDSKLFFFSRLNTALIRCNGVKWPG